MYAFSQSKWKYFLDAAAEIKSLQSIVKTFIQVPRVTEFIGTLFWSLLEEHTPAFEELSPPIDQWHHISLPLFLNDTEWQELKTEIAGDRVNACIAAINLTARFLRSGNPINRIVTPEVMFDFDEAQAMKQYALEEGLTAQVESIEEEEKLAILAIANFNESLKHEVPELNNVAGFAVNWTLRKVKRELPPGHLRSILPGFIKAGTLAAQVNAAELFASGECKMAIAALGWLKAGRGKKKIQTETHAVSGVTLGSEVSSIVPQEWLKTSLEFGAAFAEEKLWQYRNGKESGKAGDFFLLCDWSGSMISTVQSINEADSSKGEISRSAWAKAIFLKLWEIAIADNRSIHFVPFEYHVVDAYCATVGGKDTSRMAEILGAKPSGGGTNWEPPLEWAIDKIKSEKRLKTRNGKYKHCDVLYVTDADGFYVDDVFVRQLKAAKKALNFSVHVILVSAQNSKSEQKLLDTIADKVINLGKLENKEFADSANSVLLEYE